MGNLNQNKERKQIFIYLLFLFLFLFGVWFAFYLAKNIFEFSDSIFTSYNSEDFSIRKNFLTKIHHPIAQLFLQILVVLSFARIFVILFRKLHQPTVVGEVLAGILLGPSCVGLFFPEVFHVIFPKESLTELQIVSQFGLIIFMFVIGMELDVGTFKEKIRTAIFISHGSIVISFLGGLFLAIYLYPKFANPEIRFIDFGLFMGISMSIAAFPVLARIIQEKGISKSDFGLMIITCAAVDDVSAWVLLAVIISIIQSNGIISIFLHLLFTLLYILFTVYILQPFLTRVSKIYITQEVIGRGVLSLVVIILISSALTTEMIGIHALFGAFLAGVIMPNTGELRRVLTEKLEDFSAVLLLPLFFAYTGLRTEIISLDSWYSWKICGIVIFSAILGKFGGSFISARIAGMSLKESTTLGILMNTRGLMELVVLNIGYDLGILNKEIFAIMVIMALVTTLLTGPLTKLLHKSESKLILQSDSLSQIIPNKVLIPFGPPRAGETLFKVALSIFGTEGKYSTLHLTPIPDSLVLDTLETIQKTNFEGILKISKEKNIPVQTICKMTDSVTQDIIDITKQDRYGFVLMGAAKSIFGENVISGKVENILSEVNCKVGIFLDRGFEELYSLLIYYKYSVEGDALFQLGGLIQKSGTKEINLVYEKGNEPSEDSLRRYFSKSIRTTATSKQSKKLLSKYSLVLIGYNHWLEISSNPTEEKFLFDKNEWEQESRSSILIVRAEI